LEEREEERECKWALRASIIESSQLAIVYSTSAKSYVEE
jgi:hypothetical protein